MNCRGHRKLIDEYILGSLPGKRRRELEEHLVSCKDCKRELDDAKVLHEALKSQPEALINTEWDAIEARTLSRLRTEMAKPAREGFLSLLEELFRPLLRPQPRLVLALASTLVIGFILLFSIVWFQSSSSQLATDDSWLGRLWTDDDRAPGQEEDEIASLMTGVEKILSEENDENDDESEADADSALDAIAQESDLGEMDLDAIDGQMHRYYDTWAVNGGYYSDILGASNEGMVSAIQAVFGGSENGS